MAFFYRFVLTFFNGSEIDLLLYVYVCVEYDDLFKDETAAIANSAATYSAQLDKINRNGKQSKHLNMIFICLAMLNFIKYLIIC